MFKIENIDYLRPMSDLHLESYLQSSYPIDKFEKTLNAIIPSHDQDQHSALILAGDICNAYIIDQVISVLAQRFPLIILVPGNHDYWGSYFNTASQKFKSLEQIYPGKVFVATLENPVQLQFKSKNRTVNLFGSTLWAVGAEHPLESFQLKGAPDFCRIFLSENESKNGNIPFTPEDMNSFCKREIGALQSSIRQANIHSPSNSTVVVTHYVPSASLLHPYILRSIKDNIFYANADVLFPYADLWIYGHSHFCQTSQIEHLTLISNAKGYPKEGVLDFNPFLFIPINEITSTDGGNDPEPDQPIPPHIGDPQSLWLE